MTHYNLVLVGFGNVGQALARLLLRKRTIMLENEGFTFSVTGISTARHGAAINARGIDLEDALNIIQQGGLLDALSATTAPTDSREFLRQCPGDVLFENTPVNHHTGQPAIEHLQIALQKGMHAITANKGPVVHAYRELTTLAVQMGKRFLFESAVMDGAPIFSLVRETLPLAELRGFRGILNSCTNYILTRMDEGLSFEEAVKAAQQIGIAETDPSADIDGWDAAIKVAALVTVCMGFPLKPQQVQRTGIRSITPSELNAARQAGMRWKLVCQARREGSSVSASVAPELVGADSPLYTVMGTSSFVQFELDVLPGLGILETNPGPETTAFGLLADFLTALRHPVGS